MVRSLTNKEAAMFCTVRQYDGIDDVDAVITRVNSDLLPAIRDMEGFQEYKLLKCGDDELMSITVFDTEDQADQANEDVAELVAKSLAELAPNAPAVSIGEIVIESRR